MRSSLSRRRFLQRAAYATGALAAAHAVPGFNVLAALKPGDKLKCVQIGCGGRAMTHLDNVIGKSKQVLSAVVDPDEKRQRSSSNLVEGTEPRPGQNSDLH